MNAISVHQLGKKFKLFPTQGARFLEYLSAGRVKRHSDFWALQDISFEIPAGTTLGILGQNGSGKSTLLSILAGVLEQSTGSYEIHGKVSAILELGSGFHPEFSGRDNVYMYGSIMGLSRQEIDLRFNEIVKFSELGNFIDQPLRTYSSGMIIRLAFSVAVNVDADILIVDEALAVGDAIFQHRCFRKIRDLQDAGKTILYVGHDTEAVRNLCTHALLLDGGQIIERGNPDNVVNKYYALISERERTYNEGHLSEHGIMIPEGYKTESDLIGQFSKAKLVKGSKESVIVQTREINSLPRQILYAHPPSQINYTVTVEEGFSLAFSIGILPEAWDKIAQGVKFDIEVDENGTIESLFSRMLLPGRNFSDRGWHNFLLPLAKYSGREITIIFRTSGSGDDLSYCWSAWAAGKIVRAPRILPENLVADKSDPDQHREISDSSNDGRGILRYGNKKAVIERIELLDASGAPQTTFKSGDPIIIRITAVANQNFNEDLTIGFVIRNKFTEVYGTNSRWKKCDLKGIKKGPIPVADIKMRLLLGTGSYSITSAIAIIHPGFNVEVLDRVENHMIFFVRNDREISGFADLDAKIEYKK